VESNGGRSSERYRLTVTGHATDIGREAFVVGDPSLVEVGIRQHVRTNLEIGELTTDETAWTCEESVVPSVLTA
jgi:hypothetical protein